MLIISVIALALSYLYMEIQIIRSNKNKKPEARAISKVTGVGKAQIGGDWKLISTEGESFSNEDLEGKYYLMYFGFTHCPDICPNSLTKLAKAVVRAPLPIPDSMTFAPGNILARVRIMPISLG